MKTYLLPIQQKEIMDKKPLPNPLDPASGSKPFGSNPLQSGSMKPPAAFPRPANIPGNGFPPAPVSPTTPSSGLPPLPTPGNGFPSRPNLQPVPQQVEEEEYEYDDEVEEDEYSEYDYYDDDDEEDAEPITEEEEEFLRRMYEAGEPDTNLQLLYTLSTDPSWQIRDAVAANPEAPVTLLETLARDPEDTVRQTVMENQSIPADLFASFVKDTDSFVLSAWILDYRQQEEYLRPLYDTRDDQVREALISSPLVPNGIKQRLQAELDLEY